MKQIFIKISTDEGFYNKDIKDSTYKERVNWYNSMSKGQIVNILEKIGGFINE